MLVSNVTGEKRQTCHVTYKAAILIRNIQPCDCDLAVIPFSTLTGV